MIEVIGDKHTKLLLHGNDFVDKSANKRVITNTGVTVSTAQSKFGDSSFYFDGSSYLTVPGYDFGTDDFTVDWWEYPTNANAGTRFTNVYCENYSTQAGGLLVYVCTSGLQIYLSNKTGGASTSDWNVLAGKTLGNNALNTWTHRAVVRSGSNLMFFKNGTLEYTYDIGSNAVGYSQDRPWGIGNWASDLMSTGYPYIGYLNEFRVSDVARWTADFTPPAEPYPNAEIIITPGSIISPSAAQRRRMVMRKIVKMVTLTLTGSFDNSGLFGERYVTVDGEIITELGTYKVRQGSTIILHTRISPIMGGNDSYGIFVNGRCVKNALNCINHGPDYEYTVTCSCTVNGQGSVHERGGYARIDITTEEPTIDTGTDVTLNIVTGETEDGNTNKLGTIGFAKNPTTTFVNRASSNEWQTVTVNANTVYAQNTFQFNGSFTIGVEITNTLDNLLTDKVIDFWNGNADESVTNVESINDGTKITAQYTVERDATQQTVVDFEVAADPEIAATVTFTNSSIT